MSLNDLKRQVREMSASYQDREERARRVFIEERAVALKDERHREFKIKSKISFHLQIPYSAVSFGGSAQLGFSVYKDSLFEPARSDLDVACIDSDLFRRAWNDVIKTTDAFTNMAAFGATKQTDIDILKDQILRRGMIRVEAMPPSNLSRSWVVFQNSLGRDHRDLFSKITIAIYMSEYAFCWKQDSALTQLLR